MTGTKLADVMVRDPFERAKEFETASGRDDLLLRAFRGVGLADGDRPLVATPANRARNIIEAKADGLCFNCREPVWMSPSSWASRDVWTCIVCLACLERAAGMPPWEGP